MFGMLEVCLGFCMACALHEGSPAIGLSCVCETYIGTPIGTVHHRGANLLT
jgi:hypothetical protein